MFQLDADTKMHVVDRSPNADRAVRVAMAFPQIGKYAAHPVLLLQMFRDDDVERFLGFVVKRRFATLSRRRR